jgi:hypothetical protein
MPAENRQKQRIIYFYLFFFSANALDTHIFQLQASITSSFPNPNALA